MTFDVANDYMGVRTLITGGSGFIGGHLIERLSALGAEVLSVDQRAASGLPVGIRQVVVDLVDRHAVEGTVREFKPEVAFHLAAMPDADESVEHAQACVASNTVGVLSLLEGLVGSGTRRLVVGDSTKAYGNGSVPYRVDQAEQPNSSYAISKVAGWHLCQLYQQLYGLSAVAIRPTMIFGPRQAFNLFTFLLQRVEAGDARIVLSGGSQTRDPLYIEDAVDVYLRAGMAGSEVDGLAISIGGGVERSVFDLAQVALEVMGSEAVLEAREAEARPTEIWRSFCDNADAGRLLDWSPRISLEEGLRMTIDHLRGCEGANERG